MYERRARGSRVEKTGRCKRYEVGRRGCGRSIRGVGSRRPFKNLETAALLPSRSSCTHPNIAGSVFSIFLSPGLHRERKGSDHQRLVRTTKEPRPLRRAQVASTSCLRACLLNDCLSCLRGALELVGPAGDVVQVTSRCRPSLRSPRKQPPLLASMHFDCRRVEPWLLLI